MFVQGFWSTVVIGFVAQAIVYAVVLYVANIYKIVWYYSSLQEIMRLILVVFFSQIISFIVHMSCGMVFLKLLGEHDYFKIHCAAGLLAILMIVTLRVVLYNIERKYRVNLLNTTSDENNNTMVIGAGDACHLFIYEMQAKHSNEYNVRCIIDDDPAKIGMFLDGVRVVGNRYSIEEYVEKFDIAKIVFAVPSCPNDAKTEILNICAKTHCSVKVMPSIYQMVNQGNYENGDFVKQIRDVEIEDLLGRDPIKTDLTSIMDYVSDRVVMITGGGGSIGSELCRQIAAYKPKQLIIFDIYENNAYEIQLELKRKYPMLDLITLIGSVRDNQRMDMVFEKYRPEIVYHAAAHKHVPLMEDSPNEAIKNNVFGTLNTVQMADKFKVKKFVLISTDKAVNPTNIMGASKRICEMIVQEFNRYSETEFVAVRFGNVLGSNGSVIPLFKKQIQAGGPVTVTHPDIIRYFMTIPEAVSLVLQAGSSAKGGEIFVLDMGKPVKILDLAENLIRLSGFEPYKEIDIKFSGLRPGEKLFEELLMDEEGLKSTENALIHIGKPIEIDSEHFFGVLHKMKHCMADDSVDIRSLVKEIVPTFIMKQ
ncbi:MAG: polysaccharide biosynthesis protein [Clostridia bacterium]|nr:polysaccharide biosynthesis protein [Clostridia bacterium]